MASFFRRKKDESHPDASRDQFGNPIDPDPLGRAYDEWSATADSSADDRSERRPGDPSAPGAGGAGADAWLAEDADRWPQQQGEPTADPTGSPYATNDAGPQDGSRRDVWELPNDNQRPFEDPYGDNPERRDPGATPYDQDVDPDQRANREQNQRRGSFFSNRAAKFISSGVPLSMVPADNALGGLVEAAAEYGWSVTEGDPEAGKMLASMPLPIHGYRAGNVVSGRFDPFTDRSAAGLPAGEWGFVAFDALEDSKYGRTVRQCVTAVPSMLNLPDLRILPTRFRVGPSRGMVIYPTVDQVFDARYRLLALSGDAELAMLGTLVNDEVRSHLLSATDSDEVWTAGGYILVTTSVPHNEDTLARHLGILGAMLRALRSSV